MRILLDQGVYDVRNKGNVAMLQVALDRLSKIWPNARLEVITLAPHLLKLYCPKAFPVSPDSQYDWSKNRGLCDSFLQYLPRPVLRLMLELREEVSHRRSSNLSDRAGAVTKMKVELPSSKAKQQLNLLDTQSEKVVHNNIDYRLVNRIDLFVAIGGQYMSDQVKTSSSRSVGSYRNRDRMRCSYSYAWARYGND